MLTYVPVFSAEGRLIIKVYIDGVLSEELYMPNLPTHTRSPNQQALWQSYFDSINAH